MLYSVDGFVAVWGVTKNTKGNEMDIVELLRESADLDAAEHVPAEVVQMQIDAANEIERLRGCLKQTKASILNLLAVIHRDGGHHTGAVGLKQSLADAERIAVWRKAEQHD